jgi:hypothetical protein
VGLYSVKLKFESNLIERISSELSSYISLLTALLKTHKRIETVSFGKVFDECYLVLFYTLLFTFVRPLALLIFNNLTCFVCFCNKQAFTSRLDRGSKNGHEMMKKNPEVRSNA